MSKAGKTARGCLIALVIIILADVILALAVPVVGMIEVSIIKNAISPPPPPPFSADPLQARMTLWEGKLYTLGPNGSTGVYDPNSGNSLATLPGLVIGADDHLLYTADGVVDFAGSMSALRPRYTPPLFARGSGGKPVWTYSPGADGSIYQLQSGGDFVYLLVANTQNVNVQEVDTVVALKQSDGSVVWIFSNPVYGAAKQFVIVHDTLYFYTGRDLIALSANDGHLLRRQEIGANSMVSDGERLYLIGFQGLNVLSGQSGAALWNVSYQPATAGASVLFEGGVVYLKDINGQITALRAQDGRPLWHSATPSGAISALVAVHGHNLYVYENDPTSAAGGNLVALSSDTGRRAWAVRLLTHSASDLALLGVARDSLLFSNIMSRSQFAGFKTQITALSASSGAILWQQDVSEADGATLLSGDTLYIAAFLHHRRVSGALFSRRVTDCSDIASLYTLSVTSGGIQSERTRSFPCMHDNLM